MLKRLVQACALCLLLVVIGASVFFNQLNRYFWQSPKHDGVEQSFTINEGDRFMGVAQGLKQQKLIANAMWFRVMAELAGLTNDVQPGTYDLYPHQDYKTILATITAGGKRSDASVTIPEGYTLKQMGALLATKGWATEEEWAQVTGQFSPLETDPFIVAAKKPDNVDLEGYLFPDTYRFFADATATEIAQTMLDATAEHVNDLGATPDGDATGMTIHEVLTLASILEREVRQLETMKNVSDIFLKRLEIGMPLQADSTVNYVTGGDDPSISLDDRDNTDSPYNTYKYPGLPPGPISNPGDNAINAALHPKENAYFYFLTDDNGNIYYAETHDEHVENKNRYLK